MRAAGLEKPGVLTAEEESELERLHREFPALGPYKPYVPVEELVKQWIEESRMARAERRSQGQFANAIRGHDPLSAAATGSDARIIMGSDEPALIRLWREKRMYAPPGTFRKGIRNTV